MLLSFLFWWWTGEGGAASRPCADWSPGGRGGSCFVSSEGAVERSQHMYGPRRGSLGTGCVQGSSAGPAGTPRLSREAGTSWGRCILKQEPLRPTELAVLQTRSGWSKVFPRACDPRACFLFAGCASPPSDPLGLHHTQQAPPPQVFWLSQGYFRWSWGSQGVVGQKYQWVTCPPPPLKTIPQECHRIPQHLPLWLRLGRWPACGPPRVSSASQGSRGSSPLKYF